MSTSRLVADSLWQCLCPSFTSYTLATSRAVLSRRRRPAIQCVLRSPRASSHRAVSQARARIDGVSQARLNAMVRNNRDDVTYYNPIKSTSNNGEAARNEAPGEGLIFDSFSDLDDPRRKKPKFESSTGIRKHGQDRGMALENESTPMLYEMARTRAGLGKTRDVQRIVQHLVAERKEPPSLRLYSILILSNIDPVEGAAWRVASLLEEMAEEGLSMDVGLCHDVLKVLSVHLDYLLRNEVLEYMRQRWLALTLDGHHWVVAALFREGQLELGLEKLEQMKSDGFVMRPWLADLATYTLCESGEFDQALQLVKDQIAAGDLNISKGIWWHLLERASSAFNYEVTWYCWKSQVNPGYLNPTSGMCSNVLTTAARAGDAVLATDVFNVLGQRGTTFQAIHYEQLLDTYISANPPDLRAALTVLTIMASVKLEPTANTTRSIFAYLRGSPDKTTEAFDILVSLNEAGRSVPIAALNVIIEAHVHARNLRQALVVYKAMHTFERESRSKSHSPLANIETFNLLLRGTYRTSSAAHETALFLASEMLALHIKPNALTYDRLVVVCLKANSFDHAFRYFDEMYNLGFKPRQFTASILAEELAAIGDERCWDVLQRVQDHELLPQRIRSSVQAVWDRWESKEDSRSSVASTERYVDLD